MKSKAVLVLLVVIIMVVGGCSTVKRIDTNNNLPSPAITSIQFPNERGIRIDDISIDTIKIEGNTFSNIKKVIISNAFVTIGKGGELVPFGDVRVIESLLRSYDVQHFNGAGTQFANCTFDRIYPDNAESMTNCLLIIYDDSGPITLPSNNEGTQLKYVGDFQQSLLK